MKINIIKNRRTYNKWVANQTMEDFSLRYTADNARKHNHFIVANTALGSISFLALEFIGAIIALNYGFNHLIIACLIFFPLAFIINLPISWYASKYHIDIDLLSRGAGFGYIGSTITSLIYAIFTFVFFALEATIMAKMLLMTLGINLQIGYLLSSLIIIPLIMNGIHFISKFQLLTQPIWLILQITAIVSVYLLLASKETNLSILNEEDFNPVYLGISLSILLALISQIGEQVDYLRFMPNMTEQKHKFLQYCSFMISGPLWIILGCLKICIGGILAVMMISQSIDYKVAIDPSYQYLFAFSNLIHNQALTIALLVIFVLLSQLKINVTNAYAGSIALSNVFSRLTHTHPGRVVWVIFNIVIAYILIILDVYRLSISILELYAILAISWCCSLSADLLINKPLKLSPKGVEFKRAHLFDINPVGTGAMTLSIIIGLISYNGTFGIILQAYAPLLSGLIAFVCAPLIAILTKGKYYIARTSEIKDTTCEICGNNFDKEDMCYCPLVQKEICSLCCTLDSNCHDKCKEKASIQEQIKNIIPKNLHNKINIRVLNFFGISSFFTLLIVGILLFIYHSYVPISADPVKLRNALFSTFLLIEIVIIIFSWLYLLVSESRNLAKQELDLNFEELKKEVIEHQRTALLLEKAKNDADAANLAKTRYMSGISHELRTPINTIMGYAQILDQNKQVPNDVKKHLNIISRSSEYLASLIEGLLDISRIEAGKLEIHQQEVRLLDLFDQLIEYFKIEAEKKGLNFNVIRHHRLPALVLCDEKRFRQIFNNLLSNAIKYTNKGSITLEIKFSSEILNLSIKDTGIGIKEEDINKIFKPFERLQDKKSNAKGTGLGLTITKLLTTIMGGDLQVKSVYGEGSEFTLKIRLPVIEWSIINEAKAPDNIIGYTSINKENYKILVVDDDENHRNILGERLKQLGFIINNAQDYDEALLKISEFNPNMCFFDISMPNHTGWELLETVRKKHYKMPIVMISAESSEGNVPEHIKKMHNGYIVKPYKFTQIFDSISRLLDIRWQTSPKHRCNYQIVEDHAKHKNLSSDLNSNHEKTIQIQPLSKEVVAILRKQLDIGYVKGFKNYLHDFLDQNQINENQYSFLINKIDQLEFEGIYNFLEKYNE